MTLKPSVSLKWACLFKAVLGVFFAKPRRVHKLVSLAVLRPAGEPARETPGGGDLEQMCLVMPAFRSGLTGRYGSGGSAFSRLTPPSSLGCHSNRHCLLPVLASYQYGRQAERAHKEDKIFKAE